MNKAVVIAITMGDPGGIGPEIALKSVFRERWPQNVRFVLIGCAGVWQQYLRRFRLPCPYKCRNLEEIAKAKICIWDPVMAGPGRFASAKWRPGKTGRSEGLASMLWIRSAVAGCQNGSFQAMVTGPICKHSLKAAGFAFPGHTEYLERLAGSKRVAMMLIGGFLRVVLATRHTALRRVAGVLSRKVVIDAVEMAAAGVKWLGLSPQTVGVCALNPHAGEDGLLGDEERTIIIPALKQLRRKGLIVEGPIPSDVIFYQAKRNKFGAVVAMYHDQGLAPLKMIAFESGVNLTLGLPFVRTSPDHGTAFDIAGRNIASHSSMTEAIRLAIRLAGRKNPWKG